MVAHDCANSEGDNTLPCLTLWLTKFLVIKSDQRGFCPLLIDRLRYGLESSQALKRPRARNGKR